MSEFKEKKSNINLIQIKSYIINELFSFLPEKQKLNIIIYNKKIQKILLIDIEDYKRVSGKYKIIENNGKGKEYKINSNILIFEGEYLNGKRNGKGKEYNNNKLEFEGEYLNGKRSGKGKEYFDTNGYIFNANQYLTGEISEKEKNYYYLFGVAKVFEGEYLNGERNGKGKEYGKGYYYGKLIFEGEYVNGRRSGKGKSYGYDDSKKHIILLFDGEYLNGIKNGKGKEYYRNGNLKFEGEYLNGKIWNGKGYNIDGILDFEIKNGEGYIKEYNGYIMV